MSAKMSPMITIWKWETLMYSLVILQKKVEEQSTGDRSNPGLSICLKSNLIITLPLFTEIILPHFRKKWSK